MLPGRALCCGVLVLLVDLGNGNDNESNPVVAKRIDGPEAVSRPSCRCCEPQPLGFPRRDPGSGSLKRNGP
ncbi:hypothetical protein ACFQ6N_17215 [Kitasatospora sp. NPDC056446]|uniref:hypothetical protein n=1 Tax=Kitasatospora sp. NPDC056446 TaxID=3345819 RepID=UPI0036B20EB0